MSSNQNVETTSSVRNFAQFEGYCIKRLGVNMIEITFASGFNGELEDAKLIVLHISEFCQNNQPLLLLAVYAPDNSFSKEAREYIASNEINHLVKAEALVINSLALRIMGNFYLKVNKPARPSKLFNDRSVALDWLSKH